MSHTKEEKVITFLINPPEATEVSSSNCPNNRIEKKLDTPLIEISLDERKQEARKPLFIKRI
ncbi:MAG: hypothetical protein AC479_01190 [miscellaneous Crenarchaeota group-6 archaeon AD8-1]|nr:MAG: hypothetical protein AC479_01190 [miscellaneous Crenarchaeota group-6 archaeon AD8-1]